MRESVTSTHIYSSGGGGTLGGLRWGRTAQLWRGAPVRVVASPFGLLSPDVFLNSLSAGVVSNLVPGSYHSNDPYNSSSSGQQQLEVAESGACGCLRALGAGRGIEAGTDTGAGADAGAPIAGPALFLTDARCLPGSEGGAVLNAGVLCCASSARSSSIFQW